MVIDSHQHFWKYDAVKHSWIDESMAVLKNDFLPVDLSVFLNKNQIDGCISVQADESIDENDFLLGLAEKFTFIKGVVGWIDMLSNNIQKSFEKCLGNKKLKGFRYVLQDKPQRDLILSDVFLSNIATFRNYDFTYDILIFKDQLLFASEMVKQFPQQKFVIDHLAKPAIKKKELNQWKNDIKIISKYENVYCKLSGLVTEADWNNFTTEDLQPYMEVALEEFGTKRLMYGSDWPVCTLAASYNFNYQVVKNFISTLSVSEQSDIMGNNAMLFYNL